jgi:hypothetical protein
MESKLKNISKSHHKFVNDQVLTAEKLNSLINYFDEQDRLSRVFLSGIGIQCGFNLRLDGSIFINPGVGVTSDGDLIQFKGNGISTVTEKLLDTEIELTHYRPFIDSNANYPLFELDEEEAKMQMWELLANVVESSTELSEDSEIRPIEAMDLSDKVVLLYLESYPYKGDLCTAIDCDSQGEEQIAKLKVLLISEENAQILAEKDPVFTWHDIAAKYNSLPEIKPLRVLLNNVTSNSTLRTSFLTAINTTVISKLKQGFNTIFGIFGQSSIAARINEQLLFAQQENTELVDYQYRYDLLADLIDSYNEIKTLLLQINSECSPSVSSFPKHLLLGKVVEENNYKTFRHRIYKSPLSKHETFNRNKVESLIKRAWQLINRYAVQQLETVQSIKITPSKTGDAALGEKAIPYYYQVNNSFLNWWSYEKTANLKQKYNLCYFVQNLANDPEIRDPLMFNSDDFDFLRIEGHLGLNAKESRDKIGLEIQKYGLNFDCKVLDLDNKKETFAAFVKAHPSMVHRAGVPKGGTFIIVAANNQVVADFCLSYKIAEQKEQDCCSLMECSYPWISSLKYLNNLARSLRGTQSRTKFMPKNYVLQVLEYKINGQGLIDLPIEISVPLQNIFKRRIHAITEALNTRFSNGVVFDFNESQKRFLVIRAKEDRYTIRLRDITYSRSGAIYTYSNNGMFRNDLVFRADAMRCRDLKEYNPLFYEELQRAIAPINKDDDYGKFYQKWEQWYKLKDRLVSNANIKELGLTRMITSEEELPEEVQVTLRSLKNDFSEIVEDDISFVLDGDWVTGEWVDETMLDYYRKNKANLEDPIVEFINLRKFLHGETGSTKLSLYLSNQSYTEDFDSVIKDYSTFADIYFGAAPSGINAINV